MELNRDEDIIKIVSAFDRFEDIESVRENISSALNVSSEFPKESVLVSLLDRIDKTLFE